MNPDISILKNRIPRLIGEKECFKAAVCISLIENGTDYDVLFEVRSGHIPDQPGDVCFPGGAVEPGETYEEAARRETEEELLINPDQLELIGASDIMHTWNTIIYPYVGILKDYDGSFNKEEVADVFRVPLRFFIDTKPDRYVIDSTVEPHEDFPYNLIQGGRNYKWRSRRMEELFYQYNGHVIWGLTARILYAFCRIISGDDSGYHL